MVLPINAKLTLNDKASWPLRQKIIGMKTVRGAVLLANITLNVHVRIKITYGQFSDVCTNLT
jgi:hypothetical protein